MIFSQSTVEFDTLDDFILFTRYNPKNKNSVPKGYSLSENLVNNEGAILYTKDSEMDATRIGRLKRIMENNPEVNPRITLNRNDKIVEIERQKIGGALKRLIESKRSRAEFAKFMKTVQTTFESQWKNILKEPETILYISQLKFLEDKFKKTKINPFYNHALNTGIFAIGIVLHLSQVTEHKYTPDDLNDVLMASILMEAKGWESAGESIERPVEERKKNFIEANSGNYNYLKKFDIKKEVLDIIEYCYQYSIEKIDFFQEETKTALYAQIVSVAGHFDQLMSGMWEDPKTPREIIDQFYVKATDNKMPKLIIDAFAKGLKFNSLFDFYHEIELLDQSCHWRSGKPYPMTGFKSPVIYVCQNNMKECKEFVASAKSITVFKEIGGLEEGSYGRCEGLSSKLSSFYEEHYHEIKEDVLEKANRTHGKKSE